MNDEEMLAAVIAAATALLARRAPLPVPPASRWRTADRLGEAGAHPRTSGTRSRWAAAGRIW
jgi:hypothetical protein